MTPPLDAVIMKHVGAPALAAAFTAIVLGGIFLIGIAFLVYGLQFELSRWMSGGVAAIIAGGAIISTALIFVAARSATARTDREQQELNQSKAETTSALLTSNLSQIAHTAVIGLSARRPIAMLGLAAAFGAVILMMSDAEKDTRQAHGRRPV